MILTSAPRSYPSNTLDEYARTFSALILMFVTSNPKIYLFFYLSCGYKAAL